MSLGSSSVIISQILLLRALPTSWVSIPEPAPLTLIGIALVGLAFIRRRGISIAKPRTHALTHMSFLNRCRFLRLNLGVASVLLLAMFSSASLAGVIYEYREVGSPTVIGTLEVASPPASASIGWSTATSSDLIALFLDDAVFFLGSANLLLVGESLEPEVLSLDGTKLDGGSVGIRFPTIFPVDPSDPTIDQSLSIFFRASVGEDSIAIATRFTFPDGSIHIGDLFIDGNWVAQVAEPGTLMLLGIGLLGILTLSRRGKQ